MSRGKKNRRVTKRMSMAAQNTMRFGSIIIVLAVMVILNVLSSSSYKQLIKQKGELERTIKKLDNSIVQESTRWAQMTTPDRIEMALLRHGMRMNLPRADQNVRLRADGTPQPGQLSVKLAAQRKGGALNAAQYQSPLRRR